MERKKLILEGLNSPFAPKQQPELKPEMIDFSEKTTNEIATILLSRMKVAEKIAELGMLELSRNDLNYIKDKTKGAVNEWAINEAGKHE